MDKNLQYPLAKYLPIGLLHHRYSPPRAYGDITGGKVWEASQQFRDIGVKGELANLSSACSNGEWRSPTVQHVSNTKLQVQHRSLVNVAIAVLIGLVILATNPWFSNPAEYHPARSSGLIDDLQLRGLQDHLSDSRRTRERCRRRSGPNSP